MYLLYAIRNNLILLYKYLLFSKSHIAISLHEELKKLAQKTAWKVGSFLFGWTEQWPSRIEGTLVTKDKFPD